MAVQQKIITLQVFPSSYPGARKSFLFRVVARGSVEAAFALDRSPCSLNIDRYEVLSIEDIDAIVTIEH